MSPTYHYAAPLQVQASTIHQSPRELARRMVRYTEIHIKSGDIVRQEPERMKQLSATLQANNREVPLSSDVISEPHAALHYYDLRLAESPKDFDDHYYHFHYASSAAILLVAHIIGPLAAQDAAFSVAYNKAFAELQCASVVRLEKVRRQGVSHNTYLPPSSSVPDYAANRPLLPQSEAERLADVNIRVLRNMRFYSLGGGDPDETGKWQVVKFDSGEKKEEEKYSVRFDGMRSLVPHNRSELIELFTESIQL
ncbi:hypothetical protein NLJ89_g7201 [Agrocybe chaxingu]|uniref:Uncharacterized protein n=1 Tax=Agrocybe chaxingu TaxID=84603 RepID=A0A9W8JX51_9AGAR|nr:hypothetical protein NLJ89_g7201 [Agrocybe chaxingu]